MTGVIKLNSLICINFTLAYPRINTSLPDFELNREVLGYISLKMGSRIVLEVFKDAPKT
jgi:hypothetical protein